MALPFENLVIFRASTKKSWNSSGPHSWRGRHNRRGDWLPEEPLSCPQNGWCGHSTPRWNCSRILTKLSPPPSPWKGQVPHPSNKYSTPRAHAMDCHKQQTATMELVAWHAFHAVAQLLTIYESAKDSWHCAVIYVHFLSSKLFPFTFLLRKLSIQCPISLRLMTLQEVDLQWQV